MLDLCRNHRLTYVETNTHNMRENILWVMSMSEFVLAAPTSRSGLDKIYLMLHRFDLLLSRRVYCYQHASPRSLQPHLLLLP